MFPIYIEQPQTQLSLSDYIHLQAILAQEQAEREHRLLQEYKKRQEQRRIQRAMHKLQVLTELHRRRVLEEQAIEAYYEAKKQAHKRLLLERERQILLQQKHDAALRLKKQQEDQQQYRLWAYVQKSADHVNPEQVLAASQIVKEDPEPESEEEENEEVYQDQLAALVKLIFGAEDCKQEQQAEPEQKSVKSENEEDISDEEVLSEAEQEVEQNDEIEQEVEAVQNPLEEEQELSEKEISKRTENESEDIIRIKTQDKVMALDDFIDYIQKKAQSLDEQEEEESNEEDTAMEQDYTQLAMEHIDENESMDEDDEMNEVQVPSLVKSNGIQDLVNDILTNPETEEEFTQFPEEDPVKIAKYDALNRIEQELNEVQQKHEDHILNATLDFSKVLKNERPASPDNIIAATTAENRELLGYEDQVMKILLKLDMIDSDGDESIRNERKTLVKRAENMLDKLDEFKLKEWEKVSCSSNSSVDEEL